MRIEVALNPDEARELRSHAFLGSPWFQFWLRHPLAAFALVGVLFAAGKWAAPRYLGLSLVEAVVPLGLVLAGGGLFVWMVFQRLDPHRRCRAYVLELTAAGVERTCEHGASLTPWNSIESIDETSQLILFQLARGGTIGFPKRCLESGRTDEDIYAAIRHLRGRTA